MRNEGKGEELGGKIKQGIGKLIGNEQMRPRASPASAKNPVAPGVWRTLERWGSEQARVLAPAYVSGASSSSTSRVRRLPAASRTL